VRVDVCLMLKGCDDAHETTSSRQAPLGKTVSWSDHHFDPQQYRTGSRKLRNLWRAERIGRFGQV